MSPLVDAVSVTILVLLGLLAADLLYGYVRGVG